MVRTGEGDLRETIRHLEAFASRFGRQDSEDLVQEALTRAIANGISPDTRSWLYTVIRHLAIDRARRARETPCDDHEGWSEPLGAVRIPDPEEAAITSEQIAMVRRALADLPPRYREALLVFAEEGRAVSVAQRFDTTPGAAWTLLSRARARLRESLDRIGAAPAAIAARFQGWHEPVITGSVAVGLAISVVVSSSGPHEPAPSDPPRPFVAAITTAAVEPAPEPAPVAADPERAEPAPAAEEPEPADPPVHHESTVCAPEEAGGSYASVGLWFEDDEENGSLTGELIDTAVPEQVRESKTGRECDP